MLPFDHLYNGGTITGGYANANTSSYINTGFSSLARAGVDFVALRRPHKVAPNTPTDQETLNHFM